MDYQFLSFQKSQSKNESKNTQFNFEWKYEGFDSSCLKVFQESQNALQPDSGTPR